MLAGAVETYVNRYAVAPGRRAVLFANNDDAYHAAASLKGAGVAVAAIVDLRAKASLTARIATGVSRSIRVMWSSPQVDGEACAG